MQKPAYQKLLIGLMIGCGVYTFLGGLLDTTANTNIIPKAITEVGSWVIGILAVSAPIFVRVYKPIWVVNGQKRRISKLGANWWIAVFVCLALLWMPRIKEYYFPPPPVVHLLTPANDLMPETPCFEIHGGEIIVFFGNSAAFTTGSYTVLAEVAGEQLLTIKRTADGLTVSVILRDEKNNDIARIKNNVFKGSLPEGYHLQTDFHTLAILGPEEQKVFYIRFLNPSAIKVLGILRHPNRDPIIIQEESQQVGNGNSWSKSCFSDSAVAFSIK